MPRELVTKINLDLLYPPFTEKLLALLAACKTYGALYVPYFGFRSFDEQRKLYLAWKAKTGGRAAPPGSSSHQYGLAIDAYRKGNSGGALWLPKLYDILGAEAAKLGLHWGAAYGDRPHISWPGYVSAKDLEPLKTVWTGSAGTDLARLKAVWQYVDSNP